MLFVIDSDSRILRGEIMEGRKVFAGFRPFDNFKGLTLFELSENLCKNMNLSRQQTLAVISAQQEYESYKWMKSEESLVVNWTKYRDFYAVLLENTLSNKIFFWD